MAKKDWKKQLLRVKQIADQNLGRADKTEVLTDELVQLEKRIEQIQKVCHSSQKRIQGCLISQGTDNEKRLKKLPQWPLSLTLRENAALVGPDTLMGGLLLMCANAEAGMAEQLLNHERDVEDAVMAPLHNILEKDIPLLQKRKKHLNKLTLDMDSVTARFTNAQRQSVASGNIAPGKIDALREERSEAMNKVDQCKDQFVTEMFSFLARESEMSGTIVEFIESQARYHKQALEKLEDMLPLMHNHIANQVSMPVYGCPLEDHLRRTNRDIAFVLEECILTLLNLALEEEGLFRIAGMTSRVKKLKAAFDSGHADLSSFEFDVHTIAGAMKLYLRELPDPLMTMALYDEWMSAAHAPVEQRLQAIWTVVHQLPKCHYDNLRYLIKFLAKVAESSDMNKMKPSNIAIVIGPNLIWCPDESGPNVYTTTTQSAIVESMITHADWFFPGDIDFHKTGKGASPSPRVEKKQPNNTDAAQTTVVPPKRRNRNNPSLGSALSAAHPALTAPLTTVTHNHADSTDTLYKEEKDTVFTAGNDLKRQDRSSIDSKGSSSSQTNVTSSIHSSSEGEEPSGDVTSAQKPETGKHQSVISCERDTRAVTPPSKPAHPPKGFHSEVYSTLFALQSLNCGGSTEGMSNYMSQVRLLRGDDEQRFVGADNVDGAQAVGRSDTDFNLNGSNTSTPPGTLNAHPAAAAAPTADTTPVLTPMTTSLVSASGPSPSSSTSNLASDSGNATHPSPRGGHKVGKKPAPLPPERPQAPPPAPPPGSERPPSVEEPDTPKLMFSSACDEIDGASEPSSSLRPDGRLSSFTDQPSSPRAERPKGAPPDRPMGPPPPKPEKPQTAEKPPGVAEKPQCPPAVPDKPQSPPIIAEKPQSPPVVAGKPQLTEKPATPVVDKPSVALKPNSSPSSDVKSDSASITSDNSVVRQGSGGKPPRPNPPLPPRHSREHGGSDRSAEIQLEDSIPKQSEDRDRKRSSQDSTNL